MNSHDLLDPFDTCLFLGYRNPGKGGARDIYLSLSHYIHSEQFRGTDEILRDAIMQAPTPKEAKRQAAKFTDRQRPDWATSRASIIKTGILLAASQNPEVAKKLDSFATLTALEVDVGFSQGREICGLPIKLYAGIFWEAADVISNRPCNILVVGGKNLNYSDRSKSIKRFFASKEISQVLVPIFKDSTEIAEQYAIANNLPVKYILADKGRFTKAFAADLAEKSSQILVFERKGAKQFDSLIVEAKEKGKPLKLELL